MAWIGAAAVAVAGLAWAENLEVPRQLKTDMLKATSEGRSYYIWPVEEAVYSITDLGDGQRMIRIPLNFVTLKGSAGRVVSVLRMKVTPEGGGAPAFIFQALAGPPAGERGTYAVHYALDVKDLHGSGKLSLYLAGEGDTDFKLRRSNGLSVDIEL
jgi:hypothetical protein